MILPLEYSQHLLKVFTFLIGPLWPNKENTLTPHSSLMVKESRGLIAMILYRRHMSSVAKWLLLSWTKEIRFGLGSSVEQPTCNINTRPFLVITVNKTYSYWVCSQWLTLKSKFALMIIFSPSFLFFQFTIISHLWIQFNVCLSVTTGILQLFIIFLWQV